VVANRKKITYFCFGIAQVHADTKATTSLSIEHWKTNMAAHIMRKVRRDLDRPAQPF